MTTYIVHTSEGNIVEQDPTAAIRAYEEFVGKTVTPPRPVHFLTVAAVSHENGAYVRGRIDRLPGGAVFSAT